MIALQIEYLTGPNAGRKLLLHQTRISFGRSADRALPLDLPFVSREHGEFAFDHGQWQLVNHSPNGTRHNGKQVTKKPRPIKGPAIIAIGDADVFRVTPMVDEADVQAANTHEQAAPTPNDPAAAASHTGSRTKLWIGIGAFWVVTFGLIAFALLNQTENTPTTPASSLPAALTTEQIQNYLNQPVEKQTPDARQADTALVQAHEAYALIDRRADALYRAYEAYRRALVYSPGDSFADAQDQRLYYILQKRLADGVVQKYEAANFLLKSRQYQAADEAFKDLRAFYPDTDSPIFKDALQREAAARDALDRMKR